VAAIVILNGCSFFGDDGLFSSEVTEEEAVEVASAVYSEVSAALSQGIANAFDTASVQGVHAAGIEPAVTAQSFDYAEDLDGNQWSNNVTLTEGEQLVIRLNR